MLEATNWKSPLLGRATAHPGIHFILLCDTCRFRRHGICEWGGDNGVVNTIFTRYCYMLLNMQLNSEKYGFGQYNMILAGYKREIPSKEGYEGNNRRC